MPRAPSSPSGRPSSSTACRPPRLRARLPPRWRAGAWAPMRPTWHGLAGIGAGVGPGTRSSATTRPP
eukprot:15448948-Alexandrium_andersonii.AAC.1